MARLARVLALVLLLAALPVLVEAGAPSAEARAEAQDEMIGFATEYTKTVVAGIVGGGLLMNVLVGGTVATLAGAVAGSTLASWLFINQEAHNYIIQRAGPGASSGASSGAGR